MSSMQYGQIPYVNKRVSRILFGTAMEPFSTGGDGNELLDAMLAAGVNTFDIARSYANAELSVGRWMESRGNREQVVLLTKCGHPSIFGRKRVNEAEMRKDLEKSCRYLGTDYIDIYLLHRDDPDTDVGEIVEVFNALYAQGKIGAFGGSNWTHQRIAAANEYAYGHNLIPFSVSSPNYGLANQVGDPWGSGCVSISGPANRDARNWYATEQLPVIAYASLGRGLFSGRLKSGEAGEKAACVLDSAAMKGYGYQENFERLRRCEILAAQKGVTVPQIAMAFIFHQKLNAFAVVSTSSPSRMMDNIDAMNLRLTGEELAWLDLEKETR